MRSLVLFCALAIGCGSDDSPPSPPPPAAEGPASNRSNNNKEGLVRQLDALNDALKSADSQKISTELAKLTLPEPKQWFKKRFGQSNGSVLYTDYRPLANRMSQLAKEIKALRQSGLTEISIEKYDKLDDLDAVSYQTEALKAMQIPTPLYSVRMSAKKKPPNRRLSAFHLWSFVYYQGSFRFIGKLKSVGTPKPFGNLDLNEFRPRDARRIVENKKKPR